MCTPYRRGEEVKMGVGWLNRGLIPILPVTIATTNRCVHGQNL
jgi:hypothetical protein